MLDLDALAKVRERIQSRAEADLHILEKLRQEIAALASSVRRIYLRSATTISLVAADGGNNKLEFDPYLVQLVRVVDSYGRELCLDVVSPTTDTGLLSRSQFDASGSSLTPLGLMMRDLGVCDLHKLSPMIPEPFSAGEAPETFSPSWVLVYRDLCEWAVLYEQIRQSTFATDTLIVRDGLLRSKVFAGDLFIRVKSLLEQAIEDLYRRSRRRIYLVGFAKRSKVLARYQLAMAIDGTMRLGHPCYLEIPRELEKKAYVWPEYAVSEGKVGEGEAPKFVAGKMFFVKFGDRSHDQIWPVDVLESQASDAAAIFGYLLADAKDGFPVPLYPRCLQKAHEGAALVGFDMDILQDEIFKAVRNTLPSDRRFVLDAFRLQIDRSNLRYE